MANSQQEIWGPNNEYCVIDNGVSFGVSGPGGIVGREGYDTARAYGVSLGTIGASDQSRNSFANGTIPDAVNRSSVILNDPARSTRLLYLNPA